MRRRRTKSRWSTIMADVGALELLRRRPLMSVAAAAVGGYALYRWLR